MEAAEVRSEPSSQAPVIGKLRHGERVRVYSQTRSFYRIRVRASGRAPYRDGWIEKSAFQFDRAGQDGIRLFAAPVFSVYRFGATQIRAGAAYDHLLAPSVTLSFPASYSFGEGFSSIQAGTGIAYEIGGAGDFRFLPGIRLLFERFSGNGRSFLAGTVDAGLEMRYRIDKNFSIGWEPSVEWMAYATKNIPWNLRGQIAANVRYAW